MMTALGAMNCAAARSVRLVVHMLCYGESLFLRTYISRSISLHELLFYRCLQFTTN